MSAGMGSRIFQRWVGFKKKSLVLLFKENFNPFWHLLWGSAKDCEVDPNSKVFIQLSIKILFSITTLFYILCVWALVCLLSCLNFGISLSNMMQLLLFSCFWLSNPSLMLIYLVWLNKKSGLSSEEKLSHTKKIEPKFDSHLPRLTSCWPPGSGNPRLIRWAHLIQVSSWKTNEIDQEGSKLGRSSCNVIFRW